ncbi:MAG TPA: phospholipase D family protein [Candidatus Paenalcaligenes intestinipullorum]|uniref:Phospholipase D family protein n=1 Tax=Candidatus Paenalcaligenes intestinipullorum TaxID=2838718 RepID=A0A9D2RGL5_9BURK|nr:phospholipase D family protein [Candidatus Paenalcaligenes intestinipullorum]
MPLSFRSSVALALGVVLLFSLSSCTLSALEARESSHAYSLDMVKDTRLGKSFIHQMEAKPGLSGMRELDDAQEAFAIRALLTRLAEKSIDVQYYIWRNDITGMLLLKQLHEAAERGVRVRLLIDDNGIKDLDGVLALLNNHPNLEVRLFNPFSIRFFKPLNYLTEFGRLNHRMHNKSFTVDNLATIVGGRNIGDEYFGATDQEVLFADLDVLAVGAVAQDVSADFDRYWASPLSYPIDQLVKPKHLAPPSILEIDEIAKPNPDRTQRYVAALKQSDFAQALVSQQVPLEWVKVEMVSDDPSKAEGMAQDEQLLTYQLGRAIGEATEHVDLISPYFVPTKVGVENFSRLVNDRNIQVRVLTNSYDATDVAVVHAGYVKRRKDIVREGVELYELKKQSPDNLIKKKVSPFGSSSGSSLHAKTFTIDDQRVFIGSFNFDPRSAHLNTELGFVIQSPALAQRIRRIFTEQVPESSYRIQLNEKNKVIWAEKDHEGNEIIHTTEPGTGFWSRVWVGFLSKLPIEWML